MSNWKRYTFEFFSIFIAVISAFALNNWNDNRRDRNAEIKILKEIANGLQKDTEDVKLNVFGHEEGIKACMFWTDLSKNQPVNQDSTAQHYLNLTRDFVSIQNRSGYESLKSKGLETIQDDSLRFEIISLYEYDFTTLGKLEEAYSEMQFNQSYFPEINRIISPYLAYSPVGNIIGIDGPFKLSKTDEKTLWTLLWKIHVNRRFILLQYNQIEEKIQKLQTRISHAIE